jgi:cereblon
MEDDDDTEEEPEEVEDERDRLFEQYIREIEQVPPAELRENFNTELPAEHSYLGSMDRVSGIDFFEVGKVYKIPISGHDSIIFPGETLPMIMAESIFDPSTTSTDGLTFGLVCWEHATKDKVYGVTCQVYEQGVDSQGNITIKSRAHQRFKIVRQKDGSYMRPNQRRGYFADVKILPEIVLPDPLLQINSCPSILRRVHNQSEYGRIRRFVASSSPWPKFVYDQYETNKVQRKVERFLAMLKIDTVPSDPVLLSFWLARNIPITNEKRRTIFTLDSVNARMLIIGKALDFVRNSSVFDVKKFDLFWVSCSSVTFAVAVARPR